MVAIKRAGIKAQERKTGFESFDGPEPKKSGMYRARIVSVKYKRFRENDAGVRNEGLVVSVVLEAAAGDPKDHAQFDGWPTTTNLVFGDKEQMIIREENFYAALGTKDEPNIDVVSNKADDLDKGTKVNKIGGKDPVGTIVNVDLKPERNSEYDRLVIDGIYKIREEKGSAKRTPKFVDEEDEDVDEDEDMEFEGDDELGYEEREEELQGMTIAQLRKIADSDYDLDTKGLKKNQLIEAILENEFDEDEDEDVDEDEEDESEDEFEARREELEELDRDGLKAIMRKLDSKFRIRTSTTEEDLIEAILEREFEDEDDEDETPF